MPYSKLGGRAKMPSSIMGGEDYSIFKARRWDNKAIFKARRQGELYCSGCLVSLRRELWSAGCTVGLRMELLSTCLSIGLWQELFTGGCPVYSLELFTDFSSPPKHFSGLLLPETLEEPLQHVPDA